ncbi:MAG TPA: alkaline phosphatase family protein, partial [Vicinamibacterales bacterium]|nr:alkaline phosphatase family protein [Vicinamibacterales bacterium]
MHAIPLARATLAALAAGTLVGACSDSPSTTSNPGGSPSALSGPIRPELGMIKHIVIVMQENRSFDHYFGTFPGADGIPMS